MRTLTKYGNKKTIVDNILFSSKLEASHYRELKSLKMVGIVKDFELQPKYILQEKFTDNTGKKQREINYIADFWVQYADGREEVWDSKGYAKNALYLVKKKLFLYRYPNLIHVEKGK